MGDVVELEQSEMMMAAYIGAWRRTNAIARGATDIDHPCEAPFENDIVGAQSELAVARHLNLYWTGMVSKHRRDVGDLIEVRHITEPHHRLIVRDRDEQHGNIQQPFVCVFAKDNKFEMMGWLFGVEVKVEKNKERPNGGSECYMVRANELHPMNRLKKWVREQPDKPLI